jgi:cellulose synthase/poly-beta-1,6-N-acetylglucosamine synthase-like glycosyltransferase
MIAEHAVVALQWVFLAYFVCLNGGYIALNLLSFGTIHRHLGTRTGTTHGHPQEGFEPPVSILVPAYNEEATIGASVRSLLQLTYPEYEVVVVNDGSKDGTLKALIAEFEMVPFPEAYRRRLEVKPVRGIYRSTRFPNLRLLDKENGGKADALNAGINASRYPLVCGVDADSLLERNSLTRLVRPFLEDPSMVAVGGTVRIANGCTVRGGFLAEVGLPRNLLALMQIVEYLRAFLFGRVGWSAVNGLLIISGAFGLFRKEAVIASGGYLHDTIGEDMELVVRMHRHCLAQGRPYRIAFVPDPVCWTEAPETLRVLKNQRTRWQRGLAESLGKNLPLLFQRGSGSVGWLAFPFFVVFEWFGPLIEVAGYVFMTVGAIAGVISWAAFGAFLLAAVAFGIALSVSAILLEELLFHTYERPHQIAVLLGVVLLENLGYRQLNSAWRVWGLVQWLRGGKARWGEMTRLGHSQGKG